ncbi:hypothetical protein [Clostridium aceticum]|uniref:hypothetical protein n=1 Tax=Clostridium aceticum TaxID=84022 RepID=UPI0005CDD940|nr:hypothetical protein [Clostridium aceticum]KJF26131.1 hypothetical protein TZ02_14880 [Clostridium aceticum]
MTAQENFGNNCVKLTPMIDRLVTEVITMTNSLIMFYSTVAIIAGFSIFGYLLWGIMKRKR